MSLFGGKGGFFVMCSWYINFLFRVYGRANMRSNGWALSHRDEYMSIALNYHQYYNSMRPSV